MKGKVVGVKFVEEIPPIKRRHRQLYEYLKSVKPGKIVELDSKALGFNSGHSLYLGISQQIKNKYLTGVARRRGDKVYYIA